jgi:glycosyltransferase involved in cell wall biosynthesis
MKILLATGLFPPDIGGPATYSKLLLEKLPQRGISVSVVSFGEVRQYPRLIRHLLFFIKCLARGWRAELMYAQDPVSVGLPALLAATLLRVPFVVRVAGDYAWEQGVQRFSVKDSIDEFQHKRYGFRVEFLRSIQQFVVRSADLVIAPSYYFRNLVSLWTRDGKVIAIYNGIELPEPIALSREPNTIISAGRLVPWKGFAMLIEMLHDLPEWKLVIAGEGPERKALEALALGLKVSNRVIFLGQVRRESLYEHIARSEAFVLNTSFESFSYQVVEAMALGTPVITTRVGNLPEIIRDGVDGILTSPNDRGAFLTALKRLDADPQLRAQLSKSAQERAELFSLKTMLDTLTPKLLSLMHHA